ncbi:DegT/DnrJ/EryC1/StrS family aminotransferase [Streptomyces sp. AP-93]|uniref:DegT/DnrJ/EryC1/StrS family aminotransferase n=1 Tax=Streptomyces sp. AP-93 TaxID=2929048 RepID=UPI001FB0375A|nr:DegT/DnrJ/EryC1/StrS family aminotransferase [Streptomyces sp. AP-93]MCJ0872119.1 DegT/DnrJ/EryC1/StrS family aminotransferase [Streptomyces sp. AP-93]
MIFRVLARVVCQTGEGPGREGARRSPGRLPGACLRIADFLGVPDAVSVASGTAALHTALLAADIGPGPPGRVDHGRGWRNF